MKPHACLPPLLAAFTLIQACRTTPEAAAPPPGFTAIFNGEDLAGWRGGDTFDHRQWLALPETDWNASNVEWTHDMREH